jgi:large subunit ribosomal protein L19
MKPSQIVSDIAAKSMKESVDDFRVGDTVDVHVRIVEGEKERIQVFTGTVIARKGGRKASACFTVRRVVEGEGVERVFPLHSPRVEKVVVKKGGRTRRAKLHFLRGRTGKATKLAERRDARGAGGAAEESAPAQSAPADEPAGGADDEAAPPEGDSPEPAASSEGEETSEE